MWGTFGKLEQQNQLVVKNVLERPIEQFKSKAEKKAKLYYQSCLDENEVMEKRGAEPMQTLLKDIGGWSVTESGFNVSAFSLQKKLQTLQNKYNMGGLFGWAVAEDDRNSSQHVIQIDQGGLTLPTRDNYINKTAHEKVLTAYLDYMTKIAVLLGTHEDEAKPQMQEIINFETKLAEITGNDMLLSFHLGLEFDFVLAPAEDRRDEELLYHPMTLRELDKLAPFISWRDHFEDALRLVNRKVTEDERVVVYAPDYLKKLTEIVKEYNSTDKGKM